MTAYLIECGMDQPPSCCITASRNVNKENFYKPQDKMNLIGYNQIPFREPRHRYKAFMSYYESKMAKFKISHLNYKNYLDLKGFFGQFTQILIQSQFFIQFTSVYA